MSGKSSMLWSTVAKKVFMAVTGLALILFLIGHLSGNLLLLGGDPAPFNAYAHFLQGLGKLLVSTELFLLAAFLIHAVSAVSVTRHNRRARPQGYRKVASAGKPSRKSLASSSMIWTGLVLFAFVGLHLYTFKYGPGIDEGYVFQTETGPVRDLYRLTVEVFENPLYVLWYVVAMTFLGFHLRHGFWSAFQSLGVSHPRYTPWFQSLGVLIALLLGIGFLAIPVWIFFRGA